MQLPTHTPTHPFTHFPPSSTPSPPSHTSLSYSFLFFLSPGVNAGKRKRSEVTWLIAIQLLDSVVCVLSVQCPFTYNVAVPFQQTPTDLMRVLWWLLWLPLYMCNLIPQCCLVSVGPGETPTALYKSHVGLVCVCVCVCLHHLYVCVKNILVIYLFIWGL